MPTVSGHTNAIRAERVIGTDVKDGEGNTIGKVEDIISRRPTTRSCSLSSVLAASSELARNITCCRGRSSTTIRTRMPSSFRSPRAAGSGTGRHHQRTHQGRWPVGARHLVRLLQGSAVLALISLLTSGWTGGAKGAALSFGFQREILRHAPLPLRCPEEERRCPKS